ncbi:MAG: hypothetical protein C6Y22_08260 [Hapalosiphonaceae cyanobacterium JJU2]|nr:MAG: hypothetical protein C6Y22_08260 [Hapalosiphonaceae cyanobacterium JJU2]
MFICDQELKDYLEGWAEAEGRTVSNVVERCAIALVNARKEGKLAASPNPGQEIIPIQSINTEDVDQIKKFFALLLGKHERNGISFVLLGQALGFDPEELHQLYQLVQQCRSEHHNKETTKR